MSKALDTALKDLEIILIKLFNIASASLNNLQYCAGQRIVEQEFLVQAKGYHHEAEALATQIESKTVMMFIHYQPVARDLRKIKSAISVSYNLNRIAEMCSHAARLEGLTQNSPPAIEQLVEKAQTMVFMAADCYLKNDKILAEKVIAADDEVDGMFLAVKKQLIKVLKATSEDDDHVLDSLLVAKYLERIADHAVNIAKTVQ